MGRFAIAHDEGNGVALIYDDTSMIPLPLPVLIGPDAGSQAQHFLMWAEQQGDEARIFGAGDKYDASALAEAHTRWANEYMDPDSGTLNDKAAEQLTHSSG